MSPTSSSPKTPPDSSRNAASSSRVAPLVPELAIARAIRDAVCGLPGVSNLSAGHIAEVATYGPGETVPGVIVSRATGDLTVAVHIVGVYAATLALPVLADRVRDAVRQTLTAAGATPVQFIDVAIDDLRVEGAPPA